MDQSLKIRKDEDNEEEGRPSESLFPLRKILSRNYDDRATKKN
jgi:hypothetical protein